MDITMGEWNMGFLQLTGIFRGLGYRDEPHSCYVNLTGNRQIWSDTPVSAGGFLRHSMSVKN